MSQVEIRDFRVSVIWVQTVSEIMQSPASPPGQLGGIGSRWGYSSIYEALQTRVNQLPKDRQTVTAPWKDLELPWREPAGQLFWTHYFGGKQPGSVTAKDAFEGLAPFRARLRDLEVTADWWPGRINAEVFFFPHGLAIAITGYAIAPEVPEAGPAVVFAEASTTATLSSPIRPAEPRREVQGWDLPEFVALAQRFRNGRSFRVTWGSGPTEEQSLPSLGNTTLTRLRKLAFGEMSEAGASPEPFSLVTVIDASGVDFTSPAENGDIHRALEGITSWRRLSPQSTIPALAARSLLIKGQHSGVTEPSSVFYSSERGRAVWFPSQFSLAEDERLSSLACYHRNLLFASMHADSLSALANDTMAVLGTAGTKTQLMPDHRAAATQAGRLLALMYGRPEGDFDSPKPAIYRSSSVRRQIKEHPFLGRIKDLRTRWGLTSAF